MSKLELLKKLEDMIAFQSRCLYEKDWESFDLADDKVKSLERKILKSMESQDALGNMSDMRSLKVKAIA